MTYCHTRAVTSTATSTRIDLRFVDGLRAVAALGVAVFHTFLFTGYTHQTAEELPRPFKVLLVGDFAVPLFIVLSGFVLMLPVARHPGLVLRGGTWTFLKRRARRILPPYYASLALFLVLIAAVPLLRDEQGTVWDSKVPVTLGGVASHLALVHNVWPDKAFEINGPAWSVATEWQLYFAMPFLLLPLWRRVGMYCTVGIAVVVGWAIHFAIPEIDVAHLWFLGLFALGMAAAYALVNGVVVPRLGAIVAVVVPGYLLCLAAFNSKAHEYDWATETGLGVVIALLLLWMGQRTMSGQTSSLHAVLESRTLVWVGLWSYSIYLIHSPLLGLGNLILLETTDLPIGSHLALMAAVVLPISLVAAYLFHRLVERRFLTTHQSANQPA